MIATKCKIAVSALTFSLLLFTACEEKRDHTSTPARPLSTANVRVERAELQTVRLSEEVVGTVRAKVRATIEPKQAGRIEKFPIKLGDKVRCGDLVAELEAAEVKARAEQAEASLEKAEREWKRVSSLFDSNSATRSERDAAESQLKAARGVLAEIRAISSQMHIVAPFDGVITKKWAEAGDLATPGKPLADIENPNLLQVEIDVPESIAGRIGLNSQIPVVGDSGNVATGVIAELSPSFDPVTRTRRAKFELTEGAFASGQFVRVLIPSAERKAILLPKAAIVERGQLEMVFTMEKQHARMHLVKARSHTDGRIEILSGLNAGDPVIVQGAEQLLDGQPVEVK